MNNLTILNHVGIYVKDLSNSIAFYINLFDLSEYSRFQVDEVRMAVLKVGDNFIELIQRPNSPCEPPKGNWSHMAFEITNYDEIVEKLIN